MTSDVAEKNVSRILTEDVLTIAQACEEIHEVTGKKHNKSTVHRWVKNGVDGTKLEAIRFGREILTSRQALTRFIQARTQTL